MKKRFHIICMLTVALLANQASAVELLVNGNLELAGGAPPGWSLAEFPSSGTGIYDTAEQATFADVFGGGLGLFLKPFAGGADPPGTLVNAVLSQTIPANAGEGYSFAGWSRWESNYAGGVTTLDPSSPFGPIPSPTRTEMELAFLNAGGSVIGSPYLLDLRTVQNNFNFWLQHEFDQVFGGGSPLVAPAGTASLRVTAAMRDGAFNVNPQQAAFFDDFSVFAASDPSKQLLDNGDLNTAPPEFPGWDVTELPKGVNTVHPQSAPWAQNPNTTGSIGAWLRPWVNGGLAAEPNDAILSQIVSGVAGSDYSYSLWSKFELNFAGGVDALDAGSPNGPIASPTEVLMELAFLDSDFNEIGSPLSLNLKDDRRAQGAGNANDSEWRQHAINATAPAGTEHVRIMAAMLNGVFNIDPQQSAFLDDFSLQLLSGITGDFNNDGFYDCLDINALVGEIAGGGNAPSFDLTGDGLVDLADRDAWLLEAGEVNIGPGRAYKLGDANLDGAVDGSDFGVWNANKFTSVAEWCSGDFNADGGVDGSDFGAWNSNKFTSSDSAAVPEPTSLASIALLFGWLLARRRVAA